MRSFLSAALALILVFLLTAPLNGGVTGVPSAQERSSGDVVERDAVENDRSAHHAPFIKPQIAETVVAERGSDETAALLSSSPEFSRAAVSPGTDIQSFTEEPDARRALLRVYRL